MSISRYGVDKFFSAISSRVIIKNKYLYDNFLNIDTSSLSLCKKILDTKQLKGCSKDKRPDLLQLILSMAIAGPAKIPFWVNEDNGNVSDRNLLLKMMEKIEKFKTIMFGRNEELITLANSSLFSRDFIKQYYLEAKWITRTSESYQIAKNLLEESLLLETWNKYGQYRYFISVILYKNCLVNAIVVHQQKSSYKGIGTMRKTYIKAGKSLKKLTKMLERKVLKNKRTIEK